MKWVPHWEREVLQALADSASSYDGASFAFCNNKAHFLTNFCMSTGEQKFTYETIEKIIDIVPISHFA